ncbi:hypothetical protein [Legionella massiliensis]|nr:hypothetical protein [Legionella massiliensis]
MYISYAKNKSNQLIITCYHEKVQSMVNSLTLARKFELRNSDLSKLERSFSDPYTKDDVQASFQEVLKLIKSSCGPVSQIAFMGDLNLCCKNKNDLAPFLFDKTVHKIFKEVKSIHLTLESMDHIYVNKAIELADSRRLTDLTIKTKSVVREAPICKVYPSSTEEMKQSFFANVAKEAPGNSSGSSVVDASSHSASSMEYLR